MSITLKDARDLAFVTRDQAIDTVIRLMEERDELLAALKQALEECIWPSERLSDVCDKARAAIAKAEGQQ